MTEELALPEEEEEEQLPELHSVTPKMKLAAHFDALGCTREEIAQYVGCNIYSVSRWRRFPVYQAERERVWREEISPKVGGLLAAAQHLALDTAMRSLHVLAELLTDEDVRVRLKAAELAQDTMLLKALLNLQPDGEKHSAAGTKVVIQMQRDEITAVDVEEVEE